MKRILALLLALCLALSVCVTASADDGKQHDYSQSANSGIRHETCTSLLGTRVDQYYTGSYTYDTLSDMTGSSLLQSLRNLMTSTHKYNTTYNECRDKAVKTDCENGDGKSINLIYTSYSATRSDYVTTNSNGWNREHVWPRSLGNFETTLAGSDLHHIRPSDQQVNSRRSNCKYGYVHNGYQVYGTVASDLLGGTSDGRTWQTSDYFEPLDNAKGDIARIVLYMYVRYGGDSSYTCSDVTKVFQSVDVLLQWCALDPVDTWEMGRNEVVAKIQGNRNVFIDYPELAWNLFDKEIPENLITPSSGIHPSAPEACQHSATELIGKLDPDCVTPGYTGDVFCTLCSTTVSTGSAIDPLGHTHTVINALAANCGNDGYTGDTICSVCSEPISEGEAIPATGNHSFGEWKVVRHPTKTKDGYDKRICTVCDHAETRVTPALGDTESPTEPAATEPAQTEPEPTKPEDDRTNESDGDRSEAPTESTKPEDDRTNESEGDRNEVSQTPSTEAPEETTVPTETVPVETTAPTETVPETTVPESTAPAETIPATTQPQQTEPTHTTQTPTTLPDEPNSQPSNTPWIIACVIVLVGCAIGIVWYFRVGNPPKANRANTPQEASDADDLPDGET